MRPDSGHLLREEQDIAIVVYGGHLEGPEPWKHIIVGVPIILVGDELAVNILHRPLLGNLVVKACSIRDVLLDGSLCSCEVLLILSFVDLSVPLALLLRQ